MKNLFLIITLLLTFIKLTNAQPILFKNEQVDTIIINGGEHHYAYGDAQTNKYDQLIIAYSVKHKKYQIVNYERTIKHYPANSGVPKVTKQSKPVVIGKRKLHSSLNLLIENIDTSHYPIQITDFYKKRKIQRKVTFWKVWKAYKREREIEDFLDIEIVYDYYKKCKRVEDLDSLVNERFKYTMFKTHSNSLLITIKTTSNKYSFINTPQTLLQPFSGKNDKNIVNLNINTALIAILPKGFVERKSLLLEDLIESYIHWII